MRLSRRVKFQLLVFAVVSSISGIVMAVGYMGLPSVLFGIGRYSVVMQLPETGGLYKSANVSYRGQEVGRVVDVRMTDTGIEAELSLDSKVGIPADLDAQVHSRSAIGEQYVDLIPRGDAGTTLLQNGDVISPDRTSVPPDIATILDDTNRGLNAIPRDNLEVVIDQGAAAVAGLGPDLARLVKGSTRLAIDAQANLDPLTHLIDQSAPILDSQSETADSISAWASNMATLTDQLAGGDTDVRGILADAPATAAEARQLFDRLQPSLPIMLANLTGVADVALTYHAGLEQVLVLLPQAIAILNSSLVPDLGLKTAYKGPFVTFDLNLNIPPPCMTGYLPPSQQRSPAYEDYPDRPAGDLYCRVPQDSPFNVRGARNLPCATKPGKRAPTAQMCKSDEVYVPLNDGYNWKGDPNATLSGQDVPQRRPESQPPASALQPPPAEVPSPAPAAETALPPIGVAKYDPATGSYVGPDGRLYTQSNLADDGKDQTWQSMLVPPGEG